MEELSFGQWLSRRRKSQGLTQKQLAEQVHCAAITLRKIEADQRRPSLQLLERLAQEFNVPTNERSAFMHFARAYRLSERSFRESNFPWSSSDGSPSFSLPTSLSSLIGQNHAFSSINGSSVNARIRLVTLVESTWIDPLGRDLEGINGLSHRLENGDPLVMLLPLELSQQLTHAIAQSLGLDDIPDGFQPKQLQDHIGGMALLVALNPDPSQDHTAI